MKSKMLLVGLIIASQSLFAQSSKQWNIIGEGFTYLDGKYKDEKIKAGPRVLHMRRNFDGSIYVNSNKSFYMLDGNKLQLISTQNPIGLHKERIKKFYGISEFPDYDNFYKVKSYGNDDLDKKGNVYVPFDGGVNIINNLETTFVPFPDEFSHHWKIQNIVGLEEGFVARLFLRNPKEPYSGRGEFRFVYYNGAKFDIYKLPKAPGQHDKNPLMAYAKEQEYSVGDIFKDTKGNVWVAGYRKVFLFKDGKLEEQFSVREDDKKERKIGQFAVNNNGKALVEYGTSEFLILNVRNGNEELVLNKSKTVITGGKVTNAKTVEIEIDKEGRFVIATSLYKTDYVKDRDLDADVVKDTFVAPGALVFFDYPNFDNFEKPFKILNSTNDPAEEFMNSFGQSRLMDDFGNTFILSVDGETITKVDKEGSMKKYDVGELTKKAGYKYEDYKIYPKNWSIDKKTGALYFNTQSRVYTFKMNLDETFEQFTFVLDKKLGGKTIKNLAYDNASNAMWLSTSKGFTYYPMSGEGIKYFTKKETGLATGWGLLDFTIDEKSVLWVSTKKGLGEFTKEGFKVHQGKEKQEISNFVIRDINDKMIFVGSHAAYQMIDGKPVEVVSFSKLREALEEKYPKEFITASIMKACFDKENQFWAAISDNKIVHFDGEKWNVYDPKKFYTSDKIYDLYRDHQDRVVINLGKELSTMGTTPTQQQQAADAAAKEKYEDKYQRKVDASLFFENTTVIVDKNIEN